MKQNLGSKTFFGQMINEYRKFAEVRPMEELLLRKYVEDSTAY